jgi:AraC-like DNA-binding protein
MEELEIVPHRQRDSVRIFLNRVEYRSPHFHPDWELLWVLDTPLSITSPQKQHLIQPGELILFPPNYPHEFHKMERACTFLCLQLSAQAFAHTANIRTEDIRILDYLSNTELLWMQQTMLNAAQAFWEAAPFSELYYHGLCSMILHKLLTRLPSHVMTPEEQSISEQRNTRLSRLIQFVDENYMHKIRLSDFARLENRSVSYMSHFVKDTMNQTFQDYVTSVRFNRARQMIAQGQESLVSISVASGFSDYRYFSQAFLRTYGMTPAEYRRQSQSRLPAQTSQGHSLHSREEIYTPERSLEFLKEFRQSLA